MVKLTYETGIATLVQFIVLTLLNAATALTSVVSTCTRQRDSCLSNSLSSTAYFMGIIVMFAIIWQLGYQAQKKRSRNLCLLLIGAEGLIALIALVNARHHTDFIGLVTSLADIGFCIWVALLAFRLLRARGGRIVASERARKRHRPDTEL